MSFLYFFALFIFQLLWKFSTAQNVVISPEGQFIVANGRSFTITCTNTLRSGTGGSDLVIDRNSNPDTSIPSETNGTEITFFVGPVNASVNGTAFRCRNLVTADVSPNLIIIVQGEDCVRSVYVSEPSPHQCCT